MTADSKSQRKDFSEYFEEIVACLITSFLLIVLFVLYRRFRGIPFTELREQITAEYLKFLIVFLVAAASFYVLFFLILKKRVLLDILLFLFGMSAMVLIVGFTPDSFHLHLVFLFFAAILCHYFFVYRQIGACGKDLSARSAGWLLTGLFLASALLVPQVGIMRHRVFLTSGFDLGIFDQMFYHMASGEAPLTSIYNVQMNHMLKVHFSPIFYLILPIYKLIPSPKTLIFLQCLFVSLTVFPLYHLCRAYHLERKYALLFCALFLLHPAVIGGEFRDFHENKLLAFFLISFIACCESEKKKSPWLCGLFLLLTLLVREDAPHYVMLYGIYRFLAKKDERKGSALIVLAGFAYYFIITNFIIDMDIFSYRYKAIMPPGENLPLFEMVKVAFTNPLYILVQSFTAEKVKLMGLLLLPLLLLPLTGLLSLNKAFLFVPFVGLVVLQDMQWQNVNVQYYYGTICFFFLMTIQYFAQKNDPKQKNLLLSLMLFSTVIFSLSAHIGKAALFGYWEKDRPRYEEMEAEFAKIPESASVIAPNHFFPHLSHRDNIYLHYYSGLETDYILIDLRDDVLRTPPETIDALFSDEFDYGTVKFVPDWYLILKKGFDSDLNDEVIDYLSYLK